MTLSDFRNEGDHKVCTLTVTEILQVLDPENYITQDELDHPKAIDIPNPYNYFYLSAFNIVDTKTLTVKAYNSTSATETHSWIKYDGISLDKDGNSLNTADTYDDQFLKENTTNSHDCKNFGHAYYRVYMESTARPSEIVTQNAIAPLALTESELSSGSRVARTVYLESNTTGVEDVVTDEVEAQDAPVVYYNLQGVRVENPAAGAVYIRVQGDKVTKEYIR